ncbi:MAG: YARHG domain-containing protein [Lachnospiraceae bacterium]|nr:YARHG domain-containing protein [Lachnospiraceae bacterium]
MKKKRNIIKRNSGFLVGCVLAAGASFVTADTLMERGVPLMTPSTEETETGTVETVAPESSEDRVYETDAFTVTASGNIIKGVETEPPKQTEKSDTPETDENGNPVNETDQTDENGTPADNGGSSYDGGSSDGSYSGDGYSSNDSGSYAGDTYYEQPIEIYDPGNGDYYYTDGSDSSSASGSGSSNGSVSTPSDVILWGISERYIDESELYNYSADQLRLIRNEIFALHGRIFNSQDLRDYFSQKSWYVPMYAPEDFDANMFYYLNDYEEANLNVILNYEAALAGN